MAPFRVRDKIKKIEKAQIQVPRYVSKHFSAGYNDLVRKATRLLMYIHRLMYTHRLRRILSFVEKCFGGKMTNVSERLNSIHHRE